MTEVLSAVAGLVRRLPTSSVQALSQASEGGKVTLQRLRSQSATSLVRHACDQLIGLLEDGADPNFLAGALAAAAHAEQERLASSVEVVWTGPDSGHASTRLTLAVVTDLIASADRELLLVSYAAHSDPHLSEALEAAAARGVDITLLLERPEDNPAYETWGVAFQGLRATRLAWLASERTQGASMHAKVLLVDDDVTLVGSANLTSRAMESNLECGVVIRGHGAAQAIRRHVVALRERGVLQVTGWT